MELSPGVELVWWLASREAVTAKARAVEPDHFFCALLTFAEMSDGELQTVASLNLAQEKLVELRDKLRWHLRLRELDQLTTPLRREVRRAAVSRHPQEGGATLHRSEAAHRVFERAAGLAQQTTEKLSPHHLFYALLETPTPAVAAALATTAETLTVPNPDPAAGQVAATPALPETLVARAPVATPYLERFTRTVQPGPASDAPAAQDLRGVLADTSPAPRLLICPPGTPLWEYLAAVVPSVPAPGHLAAVIAADLSRETWQGLLDEARRTATCLCIDLTQQAPAVVEQVVEAVAGTAAPTDAVLVAVELSHFQQLIQLRPERANAFNPLYL